MKQLSLFCNKVILSGIGLIASLALGGAQMALDSAKDSLTEEVHKMTADYLADCKNYNNLKTELDLVSKATLI
jgi:hypothetical protein